MRQSLAEIEEALHSEMEQDRARRDRILSTTEQRATRRRLERQHKRGTLRFVLLVLAIIATAVIVTVAMFETLYYLLG
jgi:membrane glycosyltransferase